VLADGEGATEADDGRATGAAGLQVTRADAVRGAVRGAAAAGWPDPRVSVSAILRPTTAKTAAKIATPDRKLIASMRAFTRRLSRAAQSLPSLTTKHDT
jgi:hypothetical protein